MVSLWNSSCDLSLYNKKLTLCLKYMLEILVRTYSKKLKILKIIRDILPTQEQNGRFVAVVRVGGIQSAMLPKTQNKGREFFIALLKNARCFRFEKTAIFSPTTLQISYGNFPLRLREKFHFLFASNIFGFPTLAGSGLFGSAAKNNQNQEKVRRTKGI